MTYVLLFKQFVTVLQQRIIYDRAHFNNVL